MKAFNFLIGSIVLLVHGSEAYMNVNPFSAISGCLELDDVPQYSDFQSYFSTDLFRNVARTATSTVMRFGIVGNHDAHIRYGPNVYPYDNTVVEIVLAGWNNTQSVARAQLRKRDNSYTNTLLKQAPTLQLLSTTRPLVFKMEVFNSGLVQLTRDGDKSPFFDFTYTGGFKPSWISFLTCCDGQVYYFYDCP